MEPVRYIGICNTTDYLKELEDDYLMSSIWIFNVHCSRSSACVTCFSSMQQYYSTQQTLFVPLSMNPLASDSEDEKDLGRAEKEARKDAERQAAKWQYGKQPASCKKLMLSQWLDQGVGASEVASVVGPRLRQLRPPKPSSGPPEPCW